MEPNNADIIPLQGRTMNATSYLKLALYVPTNDGVRVTSQVFPFRSDSTPSRLRALRALGSASDAPRPAGSTLVASTWRYMPGYNFPVIGTLEPRDIDDENDENEENDEE